MVATKAVREFTTHYVRPGSVPPHRWHSSVPTACGRNAVELTRDGWTMKRQNVTCEECLKAGTDDEQEA